jgi:asparagine synthase (glutamine-hydrolysing)
MQRGGRLVAETAVDPKTTWALGRVHLGALQPDLQLTAEGSLHVLFHGDLHNESELRVALEARGEDVKHGTAAAVASLFRAYGPSLAQHMKGEFCAAVFDQREGRLLLISDPFGSYPLYWFATTDRIVFASELRAVIRAQAQPALDAGTVCDLLDFGFPLGDKTLAAGVRLMPPASTLTYSCDGGSPIIESYYPLARLFRSSARNRATYLDSVVQAFSRSMDRAVRGPHRYGLSLSGGLDTRVILSALDRRRCRVATFTLGGKGCADEVIADQLARMAGSDHHFVALDDGYLGDLLPPAQRMASLTDGMFVSHGFTEMRALQAFEDADFSVLLRGHAGELAKTSTAWPFHTDARIAGMRSTDEWLGYVLSRFEGRRVATDPREALSERYAQSAGYEGPRHALGTVVTDIDLPPADLCSYVYLHEYHRRVTIPSLEIFRNAVDVRLPLADIDFLSAVLEGPPQWRADTTIHRALIAANGSAYLRVRNPNTGAPAGAGRLQEAVFDKLNTVLRRLNVYGYRHYHHFDGWMRHTLLDTVQRVLLSPDALDHGAFRESTVRRLIDGARQGRPEGDGALQALTIVELWRRECL